MFRRIVVFSSLISFLWAQQVSALSPKETLSFGDAIQSRGISKAPFTVEELTQRLAKDFPSSAREEFTQIGHLGKDIKIDKVDVKKIEVQGQEQVEMMFYSGKTITTLRIENSNTRFATLKFNVDGKEKVVDLTKEDFTGGSFEKLAKKIAGVQPDLQLKLLSWDGYQKLSAKSRVTYKRQLQKLMVLIEQAQNEKENSTPAKKTADRLQWANAFLERANAFSISDLFNGRFKGLVDKACICAGYLTKYSEKGCCNTIAEKIVQKSSNGVQRICCNPDIFGATPVCVEYAGHIPNDVTQQCYNKVSNDPELYLKAENFGINGKNKSEWEASNKEIRAQLKFTVDNTCKAAAAVGWENHVDKGDRAQLQACEALRAQVELVNFSCEQQSRGIAQKIACDGGEEVSTTRSPSPAPRVGKSARQAYIDSDDGESLGSGDVVREGITGGRAQEVRSANQGLPPRLEGRGAVIAEQSSSPAVAVDGQAAKEDSPIKAKDAADSKEAARVDSKPTDATSCPKALVRIQNWVNCQDGQVKTLSCVNEQSQSVTLKYCQCESASLEKVMDGFANGCKSSSSANSQPPTVGGSKKSSSTEKSWWQQDWFLKFALPVVIAGGVGILALKSIFKSNDKVTEMYLPTTTTIVAPSTSGSTGVNRSSPAQR